jgi:hypothetical protein
MTMMRTRKYSGQAVVEFALALPLLISLLIGLAYFGFLLYAHVQVTNAAREGARAGSLYLGSRFHYTSCQTGQPCRSLAGYGDGGNNPACWTLQDWVENGLVERNRASNGCPAAGFNTTVNLHAFGLLSSAVCPNATSGTSCWWAWVTPVLGNNGLPVAGSELRVRVVYRYPRPLNATYIGFSQSPILIDKTVIMKMQNN